MLMDTTARAQLMGLIETLALKRAPESQSFTLSSGRSSTVLFDFKTLCFHPAALPLLSKTMLEQMLALGATQVGGLERGAIPLVAGMCYAAGENSPVRGFFVRKEPKGHHQKQQIDGNFSPAAPTILVDDAVTTGGSILQAAQVVREAGGHVQHALAVVERQEGGREALAAAGIELHTLFTRQDFGV